MTSMVDVRAAWGAPADIRTDQDECGTALDEEYVQDYRYPDAVIEVGRSGEAVIRALRGMPEGLTLMVPARLGPVMTPSGSRLCSGRP